ncbi:MAG: mitomycin antibiotic biosynthesis protein [Candidatus Latescibacteria bacterium]|nr:mitomycin antibiotic biosynthesis protein [Candidatus Latescibacterota bacterium]
MTVKLATIPSSAPADELCALLERDGAAIVEEIIPSSQLSALNSELDGLVAQTPPGLRHPTKQWMIEFFGRSTIRFDGLAAKSPTFVDIMQSPLLLGAADHFLLPNCEDYLLNTGQLIQIGPGETAQAIHRDEAVWNRLSSPKPQLEVEAMVALSDFTAANGATLVVPGSHLWPNDRKPTPEEMTAAEMVAGSALVYLGTALHGGGANTTQDESRRGLFLGYALGWLRTEENMFLTVPMDQVRTMPTRVQELLGYKAHFGLGVVDVGSPMELLK